MYVFMHHAKETLGGAEGNNHTSFLSSREVSYQFKDQVAFTPNEAMLQLT